jgi:hypothetical protein
MAPKPRDVEAYTSSDRWSHREVRDVGFSIDQTVSRIEDDLPSVGRSHKVRSSIRCKSKSFGPVASLDKLSIDVRRVSGQVSMQARSI